MRLAGVEFDPMAGATLVGDIDAKMIELIEKVGKQITDLMTLLVARIDLFVVVTTISTKLATTTTRQSAT